MDLSWGRGPLSLQEKTCSDVRRIAAANRPPRRLLRLPRRLPSATTRGTPSRSPRPRRSPARCSPRGRRPRGGGAHDGIPRDLRGARRNVRHRARGPRDGTGGGSRRPGCRVPSNLGHDGSRRDRRLARRARGARADRDPCAEGRGVPRLGGREARRGRCEARRGGGGEGRSGRDTRGGRGRGAASARGRGAPTVDESEIVEDPDAWELEDLAAIAEVALNPAGAVVGAAAEAFSDWWWGEDEEEAGEAEMREEAPRKDATTALEAP